MLNITITKNSRSKVPVPQALALPLISFFVLGLPVNAQSSSGSGISFGNTIYGAPGTTTLIDPLVPGANFSLPGVPAALGSPPAIGSGSVPLPPNPGMLLPTLIPWTNSITNDLITLPTNQAVAPANQINLPSNQISLPVSNAIPMPPGVMNALVRGSIPPAPSVPGVAPGMLRPPSFYNGSSGASAGQNQNSAAAVGPVGANGQLPNIAPIVRPARQGSNDFGLNRTANAYRLQSNSWVPQPGSTTTDFGQGSRELSYLQNQYNAAATIGGAAITSTMGNNIGRTAQISYDSPLPAQYPGTGQAGVPAQNSPGNHSVNLINQYGSAQVTNDLYGIPMVNPNKMTTSDSGVVSQGPPPPLTTIIPPPTN